MLKPPDRFRFLLIAVAGWMNQHRLQVIDYLREENRVLREQLGGRRLRLSDGQRRRLAAESETVGPAPPCGCGDHRYPGNAAGLATEADRAEIRRQ